MNERDKKRASELIRSEFHSRRKSLDGDATTEEIASEVDKLAAEAGIKNDIAKLAKAMQVVHELKESLSLRATALRGKRSKKSRRYDSCECGEAYDEVLEEIAESRIKERKQTEKKITQLLADERKLLAKIEVATSTADIKAVMKTAGLL